MYTDHRMHDGLARIHRSSPKDRRTSVRGGEHAFIQAVFGQKPISDCNNLGVHDDEND